MLCHISNLRSLSASSFASRYTLFLISFTSIKEVIIAEIFEAKSLMNKLWFSSISCREFVSITKKPKSFVEKISGKIEIVFND